MKIWMQLLKSGNDYEQQQGHETMSQDSPSPSKFHEMAEAILARHTSSHNHPEVHAIYALRITEILEHMRPWAKFGLKTKFYTDSNPQIYIDKLQGFETDFNRLLMMISHFIQVSGVDLETYQRLGEAMIEDHQTQRR